MARNSYESVHTKMICRYYELNFSVCTILRLARGPKSRGARLLLIMNYFVFVTVFFLRMCIVYCIYERTWVVNYICLLFPFPINRLFIR